MIPLIIFGTLLLIMFVFLVTSFLIIYKQKQKRYRLEKSELAYRYQNHLLRTRLEVEERALKTISREIHDNVTQILGIVRMNLYHAPNAMSKAEADHFTNEANLMVKDAINQLRNLSHTLSSSGIRKMGLVAAIRKEIINIFGHGTIQCSFACEEEEELPLDGEQELLIFRIVQEALSNVLKHATATHVSITIRHEQQMLWVHIIDNGNGLLFNTDSSEGIGLINMQERADLLQGQLKISFSKGRGCSVSLRVPSPDSIINKDRDESTENS